MNKKLIVVIGDIHGRDTWKDIVKRHPNAYKFVFVGDFFDSFRLSVQVMLDNFREISIFKQENPDRVILLCGNHDYHYLPVSGARYTGYRIGLQFDAEMLLKPLLNNGYLQVAYSIGDYLFTHAGVTKTWCKANYFDLDGDIVEQLNTRFRQTLNPFRFRGADTYGDNVTQGPFWVRPDSLRKDSIDGYIHVVGHTNSDSKRLEGKNIGDVILVDFLGEGMYLTIEIDGVNSETKLRKLED